jgi:hypothetical protein
MDAVVIGAENPHLVSGLSVDSGGLDAPSYPAMAEEANPGQAGRNGDFGHTYRRAVCDICHTPGNFDGAYRRQQPARGGAFLWCFWVNFQIALRSERVSEF